MATKKKMKRLKISALELAKHDKEREAFVINEKLKEAGFDLDKPIEKFKSINSFNYLFEQHGN